MTSCKPPPTCIDASPIPDANDSRMSAIPYEANLTPMGVRGQVGKPDPIWHDQVRLGVPAGAVEPEHDHALASRPGSRATAPEAQGAARAARLHCAGASHPGPRARVRCSGPAVAQ